MIFLLREKINRAVVGEQRDVGEAVAVQVAGDERVGVHAAVVEMPALRLAPAVRAEVEADDQILRVAEIDEVGAAIAVHVRHHQRGDALLGRQRVNAEARVRRQLVQFQLARGPGAGAVGVAGLVVEQGDLGMKIVRHHDVVQPVAVEVGDVQQRDLRVHGENFGAGETEEVGDRGRVR